VLVGVNDLLLPRTVSYAFLEALDVGRGGMKQSCLGRNMRFRDGMSDVSRLGLEALVSGAAVQQHCDL